MPRLMSPLRPRYMRKPPEGSTEAFTAASAQPAQAAEQPAEPEYPETVQVSEGTFRQVRDDSLVLLSQGIEHRLVRSEEGPFQIFIVPEMESAAKTQLELYHKENPPKEENPPIPLSFSLQPLWVLLAPILVTLLQFTDKINLHSEGVSDAAKVLKGEWWRSLTAQTLHGDARHLASNLLCGYIVMNMITFRIPLLRLAPFIAVAAAVANLCVSATVQTDFRSLGFSTFVFAAIGCLSVIEFRLMPKESRGGIASGVPRAWRKRRHPGTRLRVRGGAVLRVHTEKKEPALGDSPFERRRYWFVVLLRALPAGLEAGAGLTDSRSPPARG